jgi:glycosyltransferase involved in cell wall biosynthesis
MRKTLSVVLGSYNRLKFLKLTLASIREELSRCSFRSEIIIVDGGSTDGTLKWLMKQKDVMTIVQHNRGEWRGKKISAGHGVIYEPGFTCEICLYW